MSENYSKREIDMIIKGISDHIDSKDTAHEEKLDMILAQTTKHNGRMSKLENWRSYLAGGLAIISVIVIPVFSLIYLGETSRTKEKIDTLSEEIHSHIDSDLSRWEVVFNKLNL